MAAIDEKELKKVQVQLDWLPARLKEVREQAGFTQSQVGDAMGISFRRVWDMEKGRFDIKWSSICRFALAVGRPVDQLLAGLPRTYDYQKIPDAAKGDEYNFIVRILGKVKLDATQWKSVEKLAREKRRSLEG